MKSNYKLSPHAAVAEFNQTDFGRVYYNIPNAVYEPATLDELASTVQKFNRLSKKVTIRNSGYAVNGQSLTSEIQISLAKINHIQFDKENLTVKVGGGATWAELYQAIDFPKYSPPVFPSMAELAMSVGGTVGGGGVGFYSSRAGGLWNHIKQLTLMTMTGERITCSLKHERDLFLYSIAGFGRIGIICEVVLQLEPSKPTVLMMGLGYRKFERYQDDLLKAYAGQEFIGIAGVSQLYRNGFYAKLGFEPNGLCLFTEVDNTDDVNAIAESVRSQFNEDIFLFGGVSANASRVDLEVSRSTNKLSKLDLVKYYPETSSGLRNKLAQPWSDYVIGVEKYSQFLTYSKEIIAKYDLSKYVMHESILGTMLDIDIYATQIIRKLTDKHDHFPLALDFLEHDLAMYVSLPIVLPVHDLIRCEAMIAELTELVYSLGGKRDMYGLHQLSADQVEQQYSRTTLSKWQELKDRMDPKHLLNIGVIEQLD
jgi:FAD/FMN-containing dehydrogenase